MAKLTEVQQKIYDSIKTSGWFSKEEIPFYFNNRESQLYKIYEKGFLETRLVNNFTEWQYKIRS